MKLTATSNINDGEEYRLQNSHVCENFEWDWARVTHFHARFIFRRVFQTNCNTDCLSIQCSYHEPIKKIAAPLDRSLLRKTLSGCATICRLPFIMLGRRRLCDNEVSYLRTQHNFPGQAYYCYFNCIAKQMFIIVFHMSRKIIPLNH